SPTRPSATRSITRSSMRSRPRSASSQRRRRAADGSAAARRKRVRSARARRAWGSPGRTGCSPRATTSVRSPRGSRRGAARRGGGGGEWGGGGEGVGGDAFTEGIDALEAFPYPTLAALPGHTIGGGLELALACDLRVAQEDVLLGMPPAKLGLVYSHTGIRRFIDAIGVTRTRELFLLGRYIDAPTALAWGLVNRVVAAAELDAVAL